MYINCEEYTKEINHVVYRNVDGTVGGSCVGNDQITFFTKLFNDKMYKSYIEVGTFDGIALSMYAKQFPNIRFTAIDPFVSATNTGGGHREYFIENNKRLKNVHLFDMKSVDALPIILNSGEDYDFAFIDGDHSYESVKFELDMFKRIIKKGVIILHDVNMPSVATAMKDFSAETRTPIKSVGCGLQGFYI